ncbi:MAG: M56 family metallopeptidase [Cellvibrionaceae bacterium]|nr:M56 family metallopeptidase [Cellvibrionaceae bacterium]MCV6627249.1 M56 family metallopeptidase [Cellvibrionaceae bacterium]
MTDLPWALAAGLFSWVVLTLLLSWLLAVCYPLLRRLLAPLPAGLRSNGNLIYSVLPSVLALAVIAAYAQVGLGSTWLSYHCHQGVCGTHAPHMPLASAQGYLAVGLGLLAFALVALGGFWQLRLSRNYLKTMRSFSDPGIKPNYRLVQTDNRLAWCAGFLRPQIYLSSGLQAELSPSELEAVLAHEQAHALQYDNLRKLILRWASKPWPNGQAERLQQDFNSALETRCDLVAAHLHGDSTRYLLQTYCADSHCADAQAQQDRAAQLQREQQLAKASTGQLWWWRLQFVMGFGVLAALLLLATLSLGHPLLEWLSR